MSAAPSRTAQPRLGLSSSQQAGTAQTESQQLSAVPHPRPIRPFCSAPGTSQPLSGRGRGGGCRPHPLLLWGTRLEDTLGHRGRAWSNGRGLQKGPFTGKRFFTPREQHKLWRLALPASAEGRSCPAPALAFPASSFFSINIYLQRHPEVFRDN